MVEGPERSEIPLVPIRLLVVEAETELAGIPARALLACPTTATPLEVCAIRGAREGVTQLAQRTFDAVLLDLRGGISSAGEVLAELHRCAPHVPIVAVVNDQEDAEQLACKANVDDCVLAHESHPRLLMRTLQLSLERRERLRAQTAGEDPRWRLATHDLETDLPNIHLFQDRLEQALATARRTRRPCAVLCIRLHSASTAALDAEESARVHLSLAHLLCISVRSVDSVARLTENEYAVLLTHLGQASDATRVAASLLRAASEPHWHRGEAMQLELRIGVALFPGDGHTPACLLQRARAAESAIASAAATPLRLYAQRDGETAFPGIELEAHLRRAIVRRELKILYQPQFNLRRGRTYGIEALLRWKHPELGLVPPEVFIPAAEAAGMIATLGEWLLEHACAQLGAWRAAGLPSLRLSVNVSPQQLARGDLARVIARSLTRSGLSGSDLELEITESSLIGSCAHTLETLHSVRKLGVRVAIDDFGTGYASLYTLKRLPITGLKIDRIFVRDVATHSDDRALVGMILTLARSLRLEVVAEGVETQTQADTLAKSGVTRMQGFFFGRPAAAEAITRQLQEEMKRSTAPTAATKSSMALRTTRH